jgi:hypothetical protein
LLTHRYTTGVDATAAAVAQAGLQRPGIAGRHFDVHDAIVIGERFDADLVDRSIAEEQALGLLDEPYGYRFAAMEEQRALDHARPRLDVNQVRRAKQDVVLLWILEIEDVLRLDANLTDHCPRGLQLRERRQRLRLH